jgi:6-pyruvoyltetrahydropterin/6-carboxytetrahydropterin synthase
MEIELQGPVGDDGMVIDFKEIKNLVKDLVEEWDHATLVAEHDVDLLAAVRELGSRHSILPFDSTAENLAEIMVDHVVGSGESRLREIGVTQVMVRIHETETCYAEVWRRIA